MRFSRLPRRALRRAGSTFAIVALMLVVGVPAPNALTPAGERQQESSDESALNAARRAARKALYEALGGEVPQDPDPALLARGIVGARRGRLMWTLRDNGTDVSWLEAREWCSRCRVGGYSDWRLPSIGELWSLYEPTDRAPGVEVGMIRPFHPSSEFYWSTQPVGPD